MGSEGAGRHFESRRYWESGEVHIHAALPPLKGVMEVPLSSLGMRRGRNQIGCGCRNWRVNYPLLYRESNLVLSALSPFITFRKLLFSSLLVIWKWYIYPYDDASLREGLSESGVQLHVFLTSLLLKLVAGFLPRPSPKRGNKSHYFFGSGADGVGMTSRRRTFMCLLSSCLSIQ